jgi:hypothetical protein
MQLQKRILGSFFGFSRFAEDAATDGQNPLVLLRQGCFKRICQQRSHCS